MEISETDTVQVRAERAPFDMSLRLWSDETLLEPLIMNLGLSTKYLDVRGEPLLRQGPLSGRIAKRHYALLAETSGTDDGDVLHWGRVVHAALVPHPMMIEALRNGKVEGVLWIALFGKTARHEPRMPPAFLREMGDLELKILMENYTTFNNDGNPTMTWLQDERI